MTRKRILKIRDKKIRKKYEFLNQLERDEFSKLNCSKQLPMTNSFIVFDNGYRMSIQCGMATYSSPRKNFKNVSEYDSYEIACFNMDNDSIMVKLKIWGDLWVNIYYGCDYDVEDVKNLHNKNSGHILVKNIAVAPYIPIDEVEMVYQYIKKQKRKFVIIEKTKKNYEEYFY